MKVLFNCHVPFMLAHGGAQIQIKETEAALRAIDVDVEPLRWWDDLQKGDIIHFFGRVPITHVQWAHQKGIKIVISDLLSAQGSRSRAHLRFQRTVNRLMKRCVPGNFLAAFNWESYLLADAFVALTAWEGFLMSYLFGADKRKVHIVPNGVEEVFLQSQPATRGKWLVCTSTITERKRVLELAESAVQARTPVWIIGKPYADSDSYAQRFLRLAHQHPQWIRYEGAISDRTRLARIYREARGFVLLSTIESLSLSALEAAACECGLLLSDLPWARTVFRDGASYCPIASPAKTAPHLRKFYDAAPNLKPPPTPARWSDIAGQLKAMYQGLLSSPIDY